MTGARFSRPARVGAAVLGAQEGEVEHLFLTKTILVRLEPAYADSPDAEATFLFIVNQCLRFCPRVYVNTPEECTKLQAGYSRLGVGLYEGFAGLVLPLAQASGADVIVNVGAEVRHDLPWIAVNSNGWLARMATAGSGASSLPTFRARPNCIGALAAACLGAEAAFFTVLGIPKTLAFEISLYTHEQGALGTLSPGPELPARPLQFDGFLVGCGSVANSWAYAIRLLPIAGTLCAVDNQCARKENLGSYIAALRRDIGRPKVELLRRLLAPKVSVEPRAEAWDLFRIRLKYGLAVPDVIVAGLDNVETRHSVQRLWPKVMIDLGAGGLNSQVIVKDGNSEGLCLLRALQRPADEISWAQKIANQTGLGIDRILQANTPITDQDIAKAAPHLRGDLAAAKSTGQLLCGRITQHELQMEVENPDFAPSVPFVTAFTGIVGAAETVKWLIQGSPELSLFYQRSFRSDRSAAREMLCDPQCECQHKGRQHEAPMWRRGHFPILESSPSEHVPQTERSPTPDA